MISDSNPSALFTPGQSPDDPPAGDVEREAVASLKGYAYQVVVATLAWLDLDERGKLYLEVAEDYATVAEKSLNAVQVKDTAGSGSITLNTEAVQDAVAAFVGLIDKNKGRDVVLRYFTTSPVATELRVSDRLGGESGLLYWRKAAAGADLGPLRAKLTGGEFAAEVAEFVKQRSDDDLRRDLLQKIHWDAGQADIIGVTRELEERLVVLGRDKFGLAAPDARRLADPLIYQVLKTSIRKKTSERVLTRADLYSAIDLATQVVVSRQAAKAMTQLGPMLAATLAGGQGGGTFAAIDTSWMVSGRELPTPRAIISRQSLAATIEGVLIKHGQAILVGASGLGKSLAAREAGEKRPRGFATIDLRGLDASEASRRFDLALGRIGTLDFDCFIFDDFNEIDDNSARVSFTRCVEALRRRDRTAIVTCYRRPSQRALTELGLPGEAVIEIPYLTEAEAAAIVRVAGGEAEQWGTIAYAAGAQGHPQLTHAFVMGMAARSWPKAEMRGVIFRGFASDDTDGERDAARRSMVTALSGDARALLYRLSLVIGRFDRELALKVGQTPPPMAKAGEFLDELIGPWVEAVGKNFYRVSPLASNAGQGMLNADEQRAIHQIVAIQKLAHRRIDASDANSILMHALLGKSMHSLFALAYTVLIAENRVTEVLQEQFFMLQVLSTDRPILEENGMVSVMLRMAQFKLLAAKGEGTEIAECVNALFREVDEEKDPTFKAMMEASALAAVLNTIGIATSVPNWVDLLQRLKASVGANPILEDFRRRTEGAATQIGGAFLGIVFSIGCFTISTVRRLEEILLDLDRLNAADRSLWLESFDRRPSEYGIFVNYPWTAEHQREQLNAADAAERYKRMSDVALKWGNLPLALQCITARAVMFDEYINDGDAAHAVIDQAISELGEDVVLLRARAKLLWRHSKHAEAVKVIRGIANIVGLDSPVERAYALREAAISAASSGDWQLAAEWFGVAQNAADQAKLDDMHVMAVGLRADTAVAALKAGNVKEALEAMAECLAKLQHIDSDSSLRAAYCHRVIRHAVLWMDSEIDNRQTTIGGRPITMLPGACSNPDPPAAIAESPLGPLDLAWYMLAEAEISSGIDAGIDRSLRSKLENGPVLFMEIEKGNRRIVRDVITTDSAQFAADFASYLAGLEYLRAESQAMRKTFDVFAPARGEVPVLSTTQLSDPYVTRVAEDAVIAFGLAAALKGAADPTEELQANLRATFGSEFPGSAVVNKWQGLESQLPPLDQIVAEHVPLLRSGTHLAPCKVWEVGLRAFEKIRQSNFRKAMLPILGTWLRGQWRRIVNNESFRLSRPMVTVPAIEASLAQQSNDEAFVASLLLATAEAVGSSLAGPYEQQLRAIAQGE